MTAYYYSEKLDPPVIYRVVVPESEPRRGWMTIKGVGYWIPDDTIPYKVDGTDRAYDGDELEPAAAREQLARWGTELDEFDE